MQSDEMRYADTCDSAPSLSRLVMDISSDADVFVGGLAFASRTSRNLCICDSVCVFVADRRGKAPARQRCTAITHPIMTPVRHGIRHQLCLRLLARRAAGAWAGRDEKTKAKHGAHMLSFFLAIVSLYKQSLNREKKSQFN